MKRVSWFIMVCFAMMLIVGCGPSWRDYNNEKAGFNAEFPCGPESSSDFQRMSQTASLKTTTYACNVSGSRYGFSISSYSNWSPGEVTFDMEKGIKSARSSLKAAGASIVEENEVELAGSSAHEFIADKDDVRSTLRIFVDMDEMAIYTAEVARKGNKAAGEDGERFFKSIELIE
jgi:hypothetical protein